MGFTDYHTRHHLYRAILEGIGFELYHSLKRMEKRAGIRIEEIYVGGGGARSGVACQILLDMFSLSDPEETHLMLRLYNVDDSRWPR